MTAEERGDLPTLSRPRKGPRVCPRQMRRRAGSGHERTRGDARVRPQDVHSESEGYTGTEKNETSLCARKVHIILRERDRDVIAKVKRSA
jgi:hypothetical protein